MTPNRLGSIFSAGLIMLLLLASCQSEQNYGARQAQTAPSPATRTQAQRGEPLFKQYCASCHPDGGNVSDPKNDLRRSTLKAKRINKPEDIVNIMRKPVSRMIRFDASTISDADALAIAEYILETF